jgi:ribosome-binding protein aMBF1 (putative translation factor)|tara:strand:+ start:2422 stop:2757 length:336 start_codon:yes stop_codon:yes gene_type:complete
MFYRKDSKKQAEDNSKELTENEVRYGTDTPSCYEVHEKWRVECDKTSCRNWMNFQEDLNCSVVCARKESAGLSLREVADRMGVSFPRISQIEHGAFKKLEDLGVFEDFEDE